MGVKKAKCPVCGNFKTEWIGELELKRTKERFLVWDCPLSDDEHWAKGNIFLSDLKLNSFSMEKSYEIRDEIHDEEIELEEFE